MPNEQRYQMLSQEAAHLGYTAYTGPATQAAIRRAAMAAIAHDARLVCCLQSPALRALFIGHFLGGWQRAERAERQARYNADLARLKAALADG